MSAGLDPLIRDLVEWVAREPRPYAEVMELWRTSCPRLTVWEDAMERGYLLREREGAVWMVSVTPQGYAFLAAERETPQSPPGISRKGDARQRKLERLRAALAVGEADLAAGRHTTFSTDDELKAFFAALGDKARRRDTKSKSGRSTGR